MQAIGMRPARVRRRAKSSVSPYVISIVAAAVFSAGVAGVWQISAPIVKEPPPPNIDQALLLGPIAALDNGAPDTEEAQLAMAVAMYGDDAAASSEEPVEEQDPPPGESAVAVVSGAVPEGQRAPSTYFDDAVFVGDSITTGIKIYDVMGNADVFASTGLSLDGLASSPVVKQNGENISIPEALRRAKPGKIYIMMGGNSLGGKQERLIALYGDFIDLMKKDHPDSLVYIQSVLPIYEPTFEVKYSSGLTNETIDSFNEALRVLAVEKGVYYLDIASAFKDESGAMPSEFTPDGIHINAPQYTTWFDYLKTHAVERK